VLDLIFSLSQNRISEILKKLNVSETDTFQVFIIREYFKDQKQNFTSNMNIKKNNYTQKINNLHKTLSMWWLKIIYWEEFTHRHSKNIIFYGKR